MSLHDDCACAYDTINGARWVNYECPLHGNFRRDQEFLGILSRHPEPHTVPCDEHLPTTPKETAP